MVGFTAKDKIEAERSAVLFPSLSGPNIVMDGVAGLRQI
tara:strand:- start:1839 stop:1955 length:117 start_codon:yes stop_codon:yes gene_type:complete